MGTSPYTGAAIEFPVGILMTSPKWTSKRMAGILFHSDPSVRISPCSEVSVPGNICSQNLLWIRSWCFFFWFQLFHEMEEEHQIFNVWKKYMFNVCKKSYIWKRYCTIIAFRQKAGINFYSLLRFLNSLILPPIWQIVK